MKITLIGAGNLAVNLAHALCHTSHELVQIYSRTNESAQRLAHSLCVSEYTSSLDAVNHDSDLYIIAVADQALAQVADQLKQGREDCLFVHTAGTLPMDLLPMQRRGVFYPMQTFSRQRIVDFSHIPVFIEAADAHDQELLHQLAADLTDAVYQLDSANRRYLHLAAVFCCNFANHCMALGSHLLRKHGIPFSVMIPLIDETARKIRTISPELAQTGPAQRHDFNVIQRQIDLLQSDGEVHLRDIYEQLTQSIILLNHD